MLKKLDLQDPTLYGHSFGCRIISKFLIRNRDFTGKIILTAAAGIRLPKSIRQILAQFFARVSRPIKKIIPRNILNVLRKKVFGARDWANCPKKMQSTFKKVIADPCMSEHLDEITNEVLLIWGKQDKITPIEAGRIFNKKLKNSHLKVLSTGHHGIHHTHVDKIAELVSHFLKQ